jgi:hypothetical protein
MGSWPIETTFVALTTNVSSTPAYVVELTLVAPRHFAPPTQPLLTPPAHRDRPGVDATERAHAPASVPPRGRG